MTIIYNKILYKPIFVSLEMVFFKIHWFQYYVQYLNTVSIFISNHFCYNKRKETGIGTAFQYYYISRQMFVRFSWKTINSGQLCS